MSTTTTFTKPTNTFRGFISSEMLNQLLSRSLPELPAISKKLVTILPNACTFILEQLRANSLYSWRVKLVKDLCILDSNFTNIAVDPESQIITIDKDYASMWHTKSAILHELMRAMNLTWKSNMSVPPHFDSYARLDYINDLFAAEEEKPLAYQDLSFTDIFQSYKNVHTKSRSSTIKPIKERVKSPLKDKIIDDNTYSKQRNFKNKGYKRKFRWTRSTSKDTNIFKSTVLHCARLINTRN